MSTKKSTILLTNDNEHWYEELVEQEENGYPIYLEIDKSHANIEYEDAERLIIKINPGSDLSEQILKLR